MKFGTFSIHSVGTLPMRSDPDEMAAFARSVEELDLESQWVGDHILVPRDRPRPIRTTRADGSRENMFFLDPITTLSFVASTTTRMTAVGVFVLPLRNPFATAKPSRHLTWCPRGRFIFGIGIGWLAEELQAVGMNFSDRAAQRRASGLDEGALEHNDRRHVHGKLHDGHEKASLTTMSKRVTVKLDASRLLSGSTRGTRSRFRCCGRRSSLRYGESSHS
jgi:hypothetical protein